MLPRFWSFNLEDVLREKSDGDPTWDPKHLHSVYHGAERGYIESSVWRPRWNAHSAVWEEFKRRMRAYRPLEGDAVEANQQMIDALLLLESMYLAASAMPMKDSTSRNELERVFDSFAPELRHGIFGLEIGHGDDQAVSFRRLLRVSLAYASSEEVVPMSLRMNQEEIPTAYQTFLALLDNSLNDIRVTRGEFARGAHNAANETNRIRRAFVGLQKLQAANPVEVDPESMDDEPDWS